MRNKPTPIFRSSDAEAILAYLIRPKVFACRHSTLKTSAPHRIFWDHSGAKDSTPKRFRGLIVLVHVLKATRSRRYAKAGARDRFGAGRSRRPASPVNNTSTSTARSRDGLSRKASFPKARQ